MSRNDQADRENSPNNDDRVGTDPPHERLAAGEAAGAGGVIGGPTDGVSEVATTTATGIPPGGGGETEDAHVHGDSLAGTSRARHE